MRRYLFLSVVATLIALSSVYPAVAEDINTVNIRTVLSNEASSWNRGKLNSILSNYVSSFVGYDGKESVDAKTWEVLFSGKEEFKNFIEERLSSISYSMERRVLYINYREDQALCLTRDFGKTKYKETGEERPFERHTFWTLIKEGDEWKVTSFIFRFGLPEEEKKED